MYSDLYEKVSSLMQSNQVRSGEFIYTRPAPSEYEFQWLWDSCFHAIIYTHLDIEMAKNELSSLLNHRGVPQNGMIPHMTYWSGGGMDLWGNEYVSTITQPPMIAFTVLRIYQASEDINFVNSVYDSIRNYYSWLHTTRDPDDDGLLSIIHPWESGWDASVRWDTLLQLDNPTEEETRNARFQEATRLKVSGTEIKNIISNDYFHVEPVDFNAIYIANLEALIELALIVGNENDANHFFSIRRKAIASFREKMWDESSGYYWDLQGSEEHWGKTKTPASLISLFAGIPDRHEADKIVNNFLSTDFQTRYPVPTVATSEPSFSPNAYWRGSVWININWFVALGLQRYKHIDYARNLTKKTVSLVETEGFWEYYNPHTGQGGGAKLLSWSGLVLDLIQFLPPQ